MTRRDLRTLFRSNSPDLSAEEVFSDREDEWEAIARSVTACVAGMSDPGFDVEDFEEPRRNVLMFYGVGGIGKTSLSHNAAEKLAGGEGGPNHWPPLLDLPARLLPVRIDLSRQAGTDFETLMLALRLTVARLGRPMPAFDLALRRWWEANHPGQTLDEYLHGSRFLGRLSDSMSLSAQMESALADLAQAFLLPGTVGNVVGRGLRTIVRALREHRQQVRALARCRRLPDLLEAEPDLETLSYYAHLLAWDLAQLPAEQAALPVVLLDTFEDVGSRAHRELERLIQRVVWLMPNALFVITGRNRLQWDEGRLEGQLDWTGPRAWPFLVPGATQDPRQHRVGYLSAQDCDEYLCRRLTQDGEPLMGHSTRQQVISHSRGLPLYLDLAVMRFLDLYQQRDRHPSPEEFNLDFPALVARTFRDLSSEERQLLRGVSLLDSFSVELATAVAGYDRDTPALHLVERPFIDQDPSAPWPYHLHDLLRDAIRDTDADSEDRWSAADWRRAAQRAFDALGRELARAEPCGDRKVLMACLRQGLRLARDFRLDPDWLTAAAFSYIEDSVWEPIDLDFNPTRIGSPPEALAVVLHTVASRQHVHRQRTAEVLETVIESGLLPAAADELARYHLAECARDLGHLDASAAGMRHVVQANARLAGRAARGLAHLSRRLGRFPDVLDAANRLGPDGRKQRVLGDLWWTQGDIAASCAAYAAGRDEAEEQRLYGEAALSQACLAFAAAFQDRQRAQEQIDRARSMLGQADIRWATVQVSIAELLRDAGNDGDVQDRAEAVVREAEVGGLSSSIAYARFALCFHAVITGEVSLIATARSQLQRCVRGAEFAYLLELSYFMTGSEPPHHLHRAQWIDGRERTADRWSGLVIGRRRHITPTR
ncbi:ATP/GTP-binding protein [Streptomyces sp. NBC_01803]|uniref:ATP/GTP-binding protein n=1 Tax=Streptomyces sp. NBC_01803 TaxID=2975946 RepID=UPI002DDA9375|nr:ATP/GTP-binding protein [Streptomyces sp. NBC_01803]WSA47334.1 ATP/GTP-binding protein [Streptomyces sp. NBC_01803]